jgi:hypothetical protein
MKVKKNQIRKEGSGEIARSIRNKIENRGKRMREKMRTKKLIYKQRGKKIKDDLGHNNATRGTRKIKEEEYIYIYTRIYI